MKNKKKRRIFKTVMEHCEEEIQNLNEIGNEEKRNLMIEATAVNAGMMVDDEIIFEDWYLIQHTTSQERFREVS